MRNIEIYMDVSQQPAGMKVRLRNDPGRIGELSGRKRTGNGFLMLEVVFGPNDRQYIRANMLELVPQHENMWDLFKAQRFGKPSDLSKIIITEKLKGYLTNVFYSMEIGNTEFLSHQFKPVLKFIESQRGRLLVADEVGLGKTIESIYIWKELQAREASRRCLVVCPAMLREKWARDFQVRFNIEATIVGPVELLEQIESIKRNPMSKSIVLITSLEGIRSRDESWDIESNNVRSRLGGILEEMAESSADSYHNKLFDLVIIDEAHYLRNSSTASHQTARLLRDNAENMVLLSATPIQTSDENLYNLLALISPEDYPNYYIFNELNKGNSNLIRIESLIKYNGDIVEAKNFLNEITQKNPNLIDKYLIKELEEKLSQNALSYEERIDLAKKISERSFFSRYINRTRKRDVIENRVIRHPYTFKFSFLNEELEIYNYVTEKLRMMYSKDNKIENFALIARQRQMTSSLPAAFKHWSLHQTENGLKELLWDNFTDLELLDLEQLEDVIDFSDLLPEEKIKYLESIDSKYKQLKQQLNDLVLNNPTEKVVIFSFYRETINYLNRRLRNDNFSAVAIYGGMSSEEKYKILDSFSDQGGPNILISSEVGSEGIDLQFCHIIINYDLPWNPMRLEQRIGRIDRIGQKSDKIYIYNITCNDTIEDRVLIKLYDRIRIFKESIGDLEDILGDSIDSLALDLINPELSDEDRERRMEQNALAIIEKRNLRNELEQKAIDFFGFSDYILRSISDAHELNRYVSASDMIQLVDDFFSSNYPGTIVIPFKYRDYDLTEFTRMIKLSHYAKEALGTYIEKNKPQVMTRLHRAEAEILCIFESKEKCPRGILEYERIDAIHPLIQWIVSENEKNYQKKHPCSAIMIPDPLPGIPTGAYAYYVQLWSATGWKTKNILRFFGAPLSGAPINSNDSERLIVAALRKGKYWATWDESIQFELASKTLDDLSNHAFSLFIDFENEFHAENAQICEQQISYANLSAERKISDIQDLILRLKAQNKLKTIKAHEGRIRKVNEQLEIQKARIAKHHDSSSQAIEIALGIIQNGVL